MIETRQQLIKFRKSLKQSKEEFAENIGYSYSYLSKVERGRISFYSGIKQAVNDYAKRLEAYKKGTEIYEETLNRCYCNHCDDQTKEQIEKEDKELDRIIYCFALIAFIAIAGVILWIYKS